MTIALYPGTFDPITNGHLDIARRASALFTKLIIAVYATPAKNILFSVEERVKMAEEAIRGWPNVDVQAYTGLTVDFAHQRGAQVVVRGLRGGADFDYEFDMALMNKKIAPEIEAIYLMTSLDYLYISGSRIKEVAELGRTVSDLVPPHVVTALKKRFAIPQGNLNNSVRETPL
ncbi:MAG: pantetheine-phosphate adenylyltransferase [Chloroflexi bacterium]|nr:pantetheine-phosphate adenylyltransferase [Chloroflexota bacterium]